jgi:CRISPR-associated endonuclease/helicase Cas3
MIRARKRGGHPVRLVATQLVEAGVDLDFPIVYRALAGIDSLTQAAGRCNREGKLEGRGMLRVFLAPTRPPEGVLRQGLEHTRAMLCGDLDLFSPAIHAEYFERLYNSGGDDVHDTLEIQKHRAELSFEKTADAYRIVDDDWSAPLVVPFDDRARRDIAGIIHAGPSRERLRALARVTINVKKTDLEHWLRTGSVQALADETVHVLLSTSAYDGRFGLVPDRVGMLPPDQSIV